MVGLAWWSIRACSDGPCAAYTVLWDGHWPPGAVDLQLVQLRAWAGICNLKSLKMSSRMKVAVSTLEGDRRAHSLSL